MWSRFLPTYEVLQRRLTEIGEVQQVQVSFGMRKISQVERVTRPDLGGSAMLDIGIYAVNFCQMVFKVRSIGVGEISYLASPSFGHL